MEGDPASVFAQPESVVLSESAARKYFGDSIRRQDRDGDGQRNYVRRSDAPDCRGHPLTVTGVLRDLPHNTHLAVDLLVPNTSHADDAARLRDSVVEYNGGYDYVALAPGADPDRFWRSSNPSLIVRSITRR